MAANKTGRAASEKPLTTPTFAVPADLQSGAVSRVSPHVRRLVANNPSPFTFTGTCSYIVGNGDVAILDPGPDDITHIEALLQAVEGERVGHILVTHTHRDHSPAAAAIKRATGAEIVGARRFQPRSGAGFHDHDATHDRDYAPDRELADGERIAGRSYTFETIATPGHAANHLAFALLEENCLFSGDCVMAWSTSVIAPPDGSMGDYMATLDRLRDRADSIYWPGHGGPVREPQRYVRALAHHRRQREVSILTRLEAGDETIPEIVAKVYENLNPTLIGAASLSTLAHLEDLIARGLVSADRVPALDTRFRKA